jgi:hypothetical protein
MGRPPGRLQDIAFHMRVNEEWLSTIDEWRKRQPVLMTRTEAVRRLVEIGLVAKPKAAGKRGKKSTD